MRPPRLALALAAVAVVAGACGGGGGPEAESPGPGSVPPTEIASPGGDASAPSAPGSADTLWAFQAEQVTGGTFEGSSLAGRDVAVWFWAPW